MAVEPDGELELGGFGGAEGDGVGGDAGVGVVLTGDGVASDGTVVGGPDAEGVPAGPAVAEGETGEGLDPGAGGGEGIPGGDELAERATGVLDGADGFAAVGVRREGERAVGQGEEGGVLPGGEGVRGGAVGDEAGSAQESPSPCAAYSAWSVWSGSVGSLTIL